MPDLVCTGLDASNPLGFLAAIGALAVIDREAADTTPRMSWTDDVVAAPVLHDVATADDVVAQVMADHDAWSDSTALDYPPEEPFTDVKLAAKELRRWIEACMDAAEHDGGRALALVSALVAESSLDNNGMAKPTDLHFTAGQQRFLTMARALREGVTPDGIHEALIGPWRYTSELPSFKWDVTDDRVYALSATDPSADKKLTVPGAEWLALQGLTLYPVVGRRGRTMTSGCTGTWKRGEFSWPLWSCALTFEEVRTVAGLAAIVEPQPPRSLIQRGVTRVYRSTIIRSEQGGYGSFRPPRLVLDDLEGT